MPRSLVPVGLDFGMTNSLLTHFDPVDGVKVFEPPGLEGRNGIPTVTAEKVEAGGIIRRLWGPLAMRTLDFVAHFKTGLVRAYAGNGQFRQSKELKAAEAFLSGVFNEFGKSGLACGPLVVTVPETWVGGRSVGGQEALRYILKKIEAVSGCEPRFMSEPVAAACYFAHRYQLKNKRPFEGHVLVYDHGGSTLDISLVRISGNRLGVVSSGGMGRDPMLAGIGGVSFDEQVLAQVESRVPHMAKRNKKEKARWLQAFEREKREVTMNIREAYLSKALAELRQQAIFDVNGDEILLEDLLTVFESPGFSGQIESDLRNVLDRKKAAAYGIDTRSADSFRVVTVGGFSEFFPVQCLLEKYCISEFGDNHVLDNLLERNDKWLAISKGACLVAASQVHVDETCPFTFGVITYDLHTREKHFDPLLEEGRPQADYLDERFDLPAFGLSVLQGRGEKKSITFYVQRGNEYIELPMQASFDAALPDRAHSLKWQVCCTVEHGTAVVRVRSCETGKSKSISMGKIMNMIDKRFQEEVLD